MAPLCSGCDLSSWLVTAKFHGEVTGNDVDAIEFFRSHGVLPRQVNCPRCKRPCHFLTAKKIWYCPQSFKYSKSNKRKTCSFSVSDYKGTFLSNVHVAPWKILLFINHWLEKKWDHDAIIKNLQFSTTTSVNWRVYCSKVTEFWLENQEPIGGQGIVVEIDKFLFRKNSNQLNKEIAKKKRNKKGTKQIKERTEPDHEGSEAWVFGGIERESKKFFMVPFVVTEAEENLNDLLTPIIQRYIRPGSVLVSDCWGSQLTIKYHGYTHNIVNHSGKFMDSNNSGIHIENIKYLRRGVKEWVRRPGMKSHYFKQYFARYLFIQQFPNQLLHRFLVEAARMYPPQSEHEPKRTLIIPLLDASARAAHDLNIDEYSSDSSSDTDARG